MIVRAWPSRSGYQVSDIRPALLALLLALGLAGCSRAYWSGEDGDDDGDPGDGRATVASRLAQYGPAARRRMADHFARAGVAYPPARVTFIALKDAEQLEVWAAAAGDAPWAFVRTYDVQAASGGGGPKLRQGDEQVPEGVYRIDWLNPNSAYHLSLHVDYPNAQDRARAATDGRTSLGGDIMIHGDAVSIGCLAMGDQAAEDLFVLAADTGVQAGNVAAILAPTDLRVRRATVPAGAPPWTGELYRELAAALAAFPRAR
jgi:hypothetical protein